MILSNRLVCLDFHLIMHSTFNGLYCQFKFFIDPAHRCCSGLSAFPRLCDPNALQRSSSSWSLALQRRRCKVLFLLLMVVVFDQRISVCCSFFLARKLNLDIACSFFCACFRFLFSVSSFLPRKPNLAIAEHVWPGLVKKELTFGGK